MYTVFLPKTNLNIYTNNLVDEYLKYWQDIELEKLRDEKHKNNKSFVLHDGPPYANGSIHIGHAENKFYKDVLNKYFWNMGYNTPYILGWDSHGLPIENAVEKELKKNNIDKKTLSRQEFWDKCYDFSYNWMQKQKEQFKRLGVFAKHDQTYFLSNDEESVGVIECIHYFVQNNYILQKYKPVLWSYAEKTALAYAEVEYKDKKSNSIYLLFKIIETKCKELVDVNLIVWTTTPWTIPANETVAFAQSFDYVVFEDNKIKYCCGANSFDSVKSFFKNPQILFNINGCNFADTFIEHPLKEFLTIEKHQKKKMLHANFIEEDKGTGFVHIAPAHGEDDHDLGKKNNLDIEDILDEEGYYKPYVPLMNSKHVKDGDAIIIEALKSQSMLIDHSEFMHSYPHSWRSKAPLIYRLTKQWFLQIKPIKEKALELANDPSLKWLPAESKNRFISMLTLREDWCISRQRIWGVPIAIFYNKETGAVLNDADFLKQTRNKILEIGLKNWWDLKISEIDSKYSDNEWIKVNDIVDIWFESGATQHFVLKKYNLFPSDVYLEGSDQHRGWFQSSMLISAMMNDASPWKTLITHGYCLDANKQKMSKSIGNVVDPLTFNPDELRVIFGSLILSNDISLNNSVVENGKEIAFRIKNTIKFLIGMYNVEKDKAYEFDYKELALIDKWILHKLYLLDQEYLNIKHNYNINSFLLKVYDFCTQDLSSFYFDIKKDLLYCELQSNIVRKQTVQILNIIFKYLIQYCSIYMPYFSEYAWQTYCKENDIETKSVHLLEHVLLNGIYNNIEVEKNMSEIQEIRSNINKAIEIQRNEKKVTSSHDSKISISLSESSIPNLIDLLKEYCIVSEIVQIEGEIKVTKHGGQKCLRCKFYHDQIENNLCKRCTSVLNELKKI